MSAAPVIQTQKIDDAQAALVRPGYLVRLLGKGAAPPPPPSLSHVLWSFSTSFVGVSVLCLIEQWSRSVSQDLGHIQLVLLVGSFGAQAVLIFAAPGAPLSQPWNAIAGNGISATIAVLSWMVVGAPLDSKVGVVLSSALAVSLSIGAMLLARCLHPPGGATALIFTTGGKAVHDLGFLYVLFPAIIASVVHITLAVLLNNISLDPARQFPSYWHFAREGYLSRVLGKGAAPPPAPAFWQVIWSMCASFVGVALLSTAEQTSREVSQTLGHIPLVLLVGSFGAQAVLIFSAPGAPLSQPWNAIAGSAISATIAVSSWVLVGAPLESLGMPLLSMVLSSALAVSFSIVAMLLARCLHPPAGATALIFTMGGKALHDLGFIYVIFPAIVTSVFHVAIAVLVNNISSDPARQYPTHWIFWNRAQGSFLGISGKFTVNQREVKACEEVSLSFLNVDEKSVAA